MVRISFFTCVFLIGLRLVIGWHFFFEGMNKVRSNNIGPAEISKPFSSASYFAEAEGPIGPEVREVLGDSDADALAKLKLAVSDDDKPNSKMPAALAQEWSGYARRFEEFYRLGDEDKKLVDAKLEQAKSEYVLWLTDAMPKKLDDKEKKKSDEPKKIKKTVVSSTGPVTYEVDDKVQQRVLAYKNAIDEIRDVYKLRLPSLGKDVEKAHLRTLKNEATAMRAELMKDVEEHTKKLKDSLAKIVGKRLAGYDIGTPEDPKVDDRVLSLVTLRNGPGEPDTPSARLIERMPELLDQQWNDYFAYAKEYGHENSQESDRVLKEAKLRFVRYLLDQDQYQETGTPLPDKEISQRLKAYTAAIKAERRAAELAGYAAYVSSPAIVPAVALQHQDVVRYRQAFIDDIKQHTESMKYKLGGFTTSKEKDFDNFKGTVEVTKEKPRYLWTDWPSNRLEWLDWSVRWVLLVAGGCVLFGLFTRLGCLACIGFLAVEFLSNTPLPWLPVSPKSEGNYLFVNKNLIELMALFVLLTLPTGRWFGLDALLSWMWPFRCCQEPNDKVAAKKPGNTASRR